MTRGEAAHPALYWHREGEAVRCDLCPHRCLLPRGARGVCGVREHASYGEMVTLNWGLAIAPALDPVEKKPLYHWRPGTQILSLGPVGCNMACPFCQNWH
ncbi:MAG: AmmeMemoRadiSam system radical SAM enzyme, partial [Synergistales bacterium]|nr:AmmeMemoRadiSam system radical SAM enzyme [Synergistales bacterium]